MDQTLSFVCENTGPFLQINICIICTPHWPTKKTKKKDEEAEEKGKEKKKGRKKSDASTQQYINRRLCTMPTKFCELNVRHCWKLSWLTASPRFLLYPAGAAISTLNRQQNTGNFWMPVLAFNLSQVHPVANELIFPTSRPEEWQIKPVEWSGVEETPIKTFQCCPMKSTICYAQI